MAPGALAQVLRPLLDSLQESERVVVGLGSPDDAVVYRMENGTLLVATADFFAPVVDDAYTYGAIAAANSISDVYAMGGTPFLALNLAAIPSDMPPEIAAAIFRGGMEKAREAGVVVAGGHTMDDREPKYGLAVIGTVAPERLLLKGGARPGERLVLTKPLGSGVITTAYRAGKASPEALAQAVPWMLRLNRDAVRAVHATSARGATDVTGFGFLGHAVEMALAAGVRFRIRADDVPILEAAYPLAEAWLFPGGTAANEMYFRQWVTFDPSVPEEVRMLLYDAQTHGGILAAIPVSEMDRFAEACRALDQPFWEVGEVLEGEPGIEVVTTGDSHLEGDCHLTVT
ncbi:MAG: selenide, water dikinase SelD [Anaerolineae bacterium]|nr:selenide, water dikinase SelD [Anaerolineae bacterium]